MKILGRLLALFLIMPVVELALLVQLAQLIDFWPTIAIIVVTGVLGSVLAKREGLGVWRRFNARLSSGAIPDKEAVDGIIILCAGALLITPGVLTDLLGFIGLVPLTRSFVRGLIMKRVRRYVERQTQAFTYGVFQRTTDPAAEPDLSSWQGTGSTTPGYARGNSESELPR